MTGSRRSSTPHPTRQQRVAAWLAYLAPRRRGRVPGRRRSSAGGTCCSPALVTLAVLVVAAWFAVSRRGTARLVAARGSRSPRWSSSPSSWSRARACACSSWSVAPGRGRRPRRPGSPCGPPRVDPAQVRVGAPAAPRGADHEPVVRRREGREVRARSGSAGSAASSRSCSTRAPTCSRWPRMPSARGADVIGMAGGDGSQALVASVASRHGIPFVVIPAGHAQPLRPRPRDGPRRRRRGPRRLRRRRRPA